MDDRDKDSIDERIAALKAEIRSYGADILRHVSALFACHSALPIDLKNDPRHVLEMLQVDVKEILADAQEHSAYTALHKEDIQTCAALTQSLEAVAAASTALEAAEEAILGPDLIAACDSLTVLHSAMAALPSEKNEIGAGAVCQVLRNTTSLAQGRFQSRLRRLLEHAVQVHRGRIQVMKSVRGGVPREEQWRGADEGDGIQLRDIWRAVLTTKEGDAMIRRVVQQVWTDVLRPLWREKKPLAPSIVIATSAASTTTLSNAGVSSSSSTSEICFDFSLGNVAIAGEANTSSSEEKIGLAQNSACRMKFPQLLEAVSHVMGFMYSEVFLADEEVLSVCQSFLSDASVAFFPTLSNTLLAILPKHEPEMEAFTSAVTAPCHEFEQKMNLFGFLSSDEARGHSGPLSTTVQALYAHFLSVRRFEILAKARSLVLGDYHNTMLGTGDALEDETSSAGNIGDRQALLEQSGSSAFSPFQSLQFESCQISLACCRLLKLMHEVLKQATDGSSGPAVAVMLYRTSRDCLDIFEGVVQSKYADSIQSVPRMGAVFFNDCAYIAHNTTLLTHLYRQELGQVAPDLADAIGYIDFIPRFRSVGEKCLGDHVESQKRTLRELVGAVRIRAGEEDEDGEICDREDEGGVNDAEAALRVVKHLHRLQGQWQHILQDSVYERLMGYLLEYVIRLVMKPVFEAKYISEVAATDITKLYKELQKSNTLFEEPLVMSSSSPSHGSTSAGGRNSTLSSSTSGGSSQLAASGTAGTGGGSAVVGGLVSWSKFCALTDLLEFSLSDISEWLPRRKFAMFTGPEMSSLIRALFEDSPRRQNILASILEMAS